jgi:allantoicase
MGDGWETARRRKPGNDWVILALGFPGVVEKVEIDTAHFKGNYPDRAAIQAALLTKTDLEDIEVASETWATLLPESKLDMDRQHYFTDRLQDIGAISHVRLSIFPDGGISRLRLYGRVAGDFGPT